MILAAVAVGILLRLYTYGQVVMGNRIHVLSPDCAYHLRRARFAACSFPRTILLDPLINFPQGAICIWPPFFDLVLAAPARILHGKNASAGEVERGAAAVPLLFAALAIAGAGMAGFSLRRRYGVAAAVFVALCTGHIHYSQYGQTDQHVAESCWGFWTLALYLQTCRRDLRILEALTGICLGVAVLTWQGAIFWAPLLAFGILADAWSRPSPRALRRTLLVLCLPAALVAAATGFWLRGFSPPFTYISFGWFQPVFLDAVFVATLVLVVFLCRRVVAKPWRAGALGLAAAVGAVLIPLMREFLFPLREGIAHLASRSHGSDIVGGGFISYSRGWLAQIAEYRPLFEGDLRLPAQLLSFSFLLSPVVLAIWGARALKGRRIDLNAALFAWGSFTLLIAITQRRNMYYAALLAALAAVEIAHLVAIRLTRRLATAERRHAPLLIFSVTFAALMIPMLIGLSHEVRARYVPDGDLFETLDRLGKIVPRPVDAYDPRFLRPDARAPELERAVGVLGPWSLGHWITYGAEVPVAADNFGYGFFDSVRFFLADDEDVAIRIAEARRCRFILAADLLPKMNDYAALLGLPPYSVETPQSSAWSPRYFRTIQARLYEFDGRGGQLPNGLTIPPLPRFRLRFASRTGERRFGRFVARWKIFEILPD